MPETGCSVHSNMANKTRQSSGSVTAFLNAVGDPAKRADCRKIAKMMRAATGKRPRMWGDSIVGYGTYDYRYDSGREGSFFLTGFSPRARNIVVYIMPGFGHFGAIMAKLGRYKTGKSCLYLKSLNDVDEKMLQTLIDESVARMHDNYVTY